MTAQLAMVLALLGLAIGMFVTGRPRTDVVALLMLLLLPLTGTVTVPEALAGFGDASVLLVAALFVVGEGLVRTGIARRLGDWLLARARGSATRLLVLLMLIVGLTGSVMSSTGVVAIFIPVVLRICTRLGIPPGQLMMPLSVAALISGMMTLVATAPNLVVQAELTRQGLPGFGFFGFTPFGLPILLLGIGYMLLARRRLSAGPAEDGTTPGARTTLRQLVEDYRLQDRAHRLRLRAGSPLAGQRLDKLALRARHRLNVMAVERPARFGTEIFSPNAETVLRADDELLVELPATPQDLAEIARRLGLQPLPIEHSDLAHRPHAVGIAEMIVTPGAELTGKSVLEAKLRSRLGLTVAGMRRGNAPVAEGMLEKPLQAGDSLLVVGPWTDIRRSQRGRRDLLLLNQPEDLEELTPAATRAPYALLSLAVMVALMVSGLVPNVQAAFIAGLLMLGFRCLDMDSAYRAIHWPSLVLIVGMLPFSLALQRTGGVTLAADALIATVGEAGPHALLASLFALTAVTGLFISNTATAVLMTPVAIATAQETGLSPYPFAMIVALASSAAFMTPVSSPVNTLVMGPGRYRFGDFLRIGLPLAVLVMAVSVALVPLVLPLR
ncbi:Transporter, Divalent Anion:Sodium Symporter family [Roseomonas mucosa]|uniref:SLC13 family permease n=2 Tax=Roseomonas mucosa TaxID=207340 RepID=A0A1S8D8S8_9PROT|nr:SLC13 family permease [Roseomonas mucosa]AWV21755.1 Transporter, Divalent Anion:Sodium Symporter family [Roseomonas mucosa]MDT8354889.1 SLC13 family permease [Roseomonas mucosa]ONH84020.1 SLC13 family permease [Roseomonas mucosa]QDJ08673.1 Transporter, Divalent Anion:Sodium Symporter family [Roseomonas mucosa]